MTVDVSELIKLKNEIAEKKDKRSKLDKKISKLTKQLQDTCEHPTINTTDYYCSGGYDYLSSVTITKTCSICDKVLETYADPKHRGHYG